MGQLLREGALRVLRRAAEGKKGPQIVPRADRAAHQRSWEALGSAPKPCLAAGERLEPSSGELCSILATALMAVQVSGLGMCWLINSH